MMSLLLFIDYNISFKTDKTKLLAFVFNKLKLYYESKLDDIITTTSFLENLKNTAF